MYPPSAPTEFAFLSSTIQSFTSTDNGGINSSDATWNITARPSSLQNFIGSFSENREDNTKVSVYTDNLKPTPIDVIFRFKQRIVMTPFMEIKGFKHHNGKRIDVESIVPELKDKFPVPNLDKIAKDLLFDQQSCLGKFLL